MNHQRKNSSDNLNGFNDLAILQDELAKSKLEAQKLNNQLACLISLVQSAWTGDREAAIHVANIVGVAPPELKAEKIDNTKVAFTAIPKPMAVNNWAKLAIGLLNRAYKHEEYENETNQYQYLEERNDFLDDQIYEHHQLISRPNTGSNHSVYHKIMEKIIKHDRPGTATAGSIERPASGSLNRKKGVIGHLYRSPSKNPELTWGDLFIHGGKGPSQESNNKERYQNEVHGLQERDPTRLQRKSSNDDTDPFSKVDLFALDSILSDSQRKKVSISSTSLLSNDTRRARPKSSVVIRPKSSRPLKYETTRPISASSNKVHFIGDSVSDHNLRSKPPTARLKKQRPQSSIVRHPSHIDDFVKDQEQLSVMEEQFCNRALQLQRKLGIRENGLVL